MSFQSLPSALSRAAPIAACKCARLGSFLYVKCVRRQSENCYQHTLTPSVPTMQDMEETKREAAQVVELLDLRQGGLTQTLDGGFPELRNSVWQSEISVQSAVQVCTCCRGSPLQAAWHASRLATVSFSKAQQVLHLSCYWFSLPSDLMWGS